MLDLQTKISLQSGVAFIIKLGARPKNTTTCVEFTIRDIKKSNLMVKVKSDQGYFLVARQFTGTGYAQVVELTNADPQCRFWSATLK